jgi:nucleoside-diphosphate-sugar epimerase
MTSLFCFGMGYSAVELAGRLKPRGWAVSGTSTSRDGAVALEMQGFPAHVFAGHPATVAGDIAPMDPRLLADLESATHAVTSVPPDASGDPVLRRFGLALTLAENLKWIGYLSTIGVYGDHQGGWVDETTLVSPGSDRSRRRVEAENAWVKFGVRTGKQVQIFRLAGIYGPGRSAIDTVRDGSARRIIKPGQVFNRTHVADIAGVLEAAISLPCAHTVFNVTDDEPAPPQDVIAYAAHLLSLPVPPGINYEDATFSAMGRSFYSENKRVRNDRIKSALGVTLRYPSYREGLEALAKSAA